MANTEAPQTPHNALRIIEAKLHKFDNYINDTDSVWASLDLLWTHVVTGADK